MFGENVLWSFRQIALEANIDLIESEAQFDHVHLLLHVTQDQSLSEVMRRLKGGASREVFLNSPELRDDFGRYFWQRGYGFRLVPEDQIDTVRHYIQTQEDRPLRH